VRHSTTGIRLVPRPPCVEEPCASVAGEADAAAGTWRPRRKRHERDVDRWKAVVEGHALRQVAFGGDCEAVLGAVPRVVALDVPGGDSHRRRRRARPSRAARPQRRGTTRVRRPVRARARGAGAVRRHGCESGRGGGRRRQGRGSCGAVAGPGREARREQESPPGRRCRGRVPFRGAPAVSRRRRWCCSRGSPRDRAARRAPLARARRRAAIPGRRRGRRGREAVLRGLANGRRCETSRRVDPAGQDVVEHAGSAADPEHRRPRDQRRMPREGKQGAPPSRRGSGSDPRDGCSSREG